MKKTMQVLSVFMVCMVAFSVAAHATTGTGLQPAGAYENGAQTLGRVFIYLCGSVMKLFGANVNPDDAFK